MTLHNNPFTLSFGRKPLEYISRPVQTDMILDNFMADHSPNQVFMISGVRGAGKTVLLANVVSQLKENKDWIIAELSPERDLLNALAARLYNSKMQISFAEAKIDLSFLGLGVSVQGGAPISDLETAIEKMLSVLKKKGKRLLITVDEVVNNQYVREFASVFQIFMRQEYPVYLLMTGLYENIYNLQNEKTLTFLYRAPKIVLPSLNTAAIINRYRLIFGIDEERASQMATLTLGYPFAFQLLGYLCWEHGGADYIEEVLPEYDQYLDEYVYSKIWSELSSLDRQILISMAKDGERSVTAIRKNIDMSTEKFSVYRKRLLNKGIVLAAGYGELAFALPRFDLFIKMQSLL